MKPLRPYQTDARYQLNTLVNGGRNPVFVSPTGTGKTWTAIGTIADRVALGKRVYVLTPQIEIFKQWVRDLATAGLNPGTIADGKVEGASRSVYVVMPLTLANLLPYIPEEIYPDEIWTDEAHHAAADTWETIYDRFRAARRVGLTATPQRTDGKGLDHLYTDIVSTITMREAIDAGFLARPLPVVPEVYLGKVGIKNGEFDPQEQAAALGKTQIVGDVIGNYGYVFSGLPVLVACSTFDHAADMTAAFCEAGWRFEHIHSNLAPAERARMIREIRTGKLNGLCTVGIGIEGMDIPGLYGLLWLRRTMSLTIYLQFVGRVLRPLPGKPYGIILDFVGNLFIHGYPEADRAWTLQGRGEPGGTGGSGPEPLVMRICPFCGVANAAVNTSCHFCGADLDSEEAKAARKRKLPAMVDGELVAVESDGQAEAIRARAEKIRAEQDAHQKAEDASRAAGISPEEAPVSSTDRLRALRRGLFGSGRRKLFEEAVKNYL